MATSQDPITVTNDMFKINIFGYQLKFGKLVESYDDMTDFVKNLDVKE